MKAVILAAGYGSRLKPLTEEQQKCLLEINGKTILKLIIDKIRTYGIKQIAVVVGYKAEKVIKELENENVVFIHNKEYHKGMTSSILAAKQYVDNDDFLLHWGDVLVETDLMQLITKHVTNNNELTMSLIKHKTPQHNAIVLVESDKIEQIIKKSDTVTSSYTDPGIMLLKGSLLKHIERNGDFYDGLNELLNNIKCGHIIYNTEMFNINTIDELEKVREVFKKCRAGTHDGSRKAF